MADTFNIFLRDAQDQDSRSRGIRQRFQVGSRFITADGANGLFSTSASQIVGSRPIYIDFDLTLKIAGAIRTMGAAAMRGCAEAANAAAIRVQTKLTRLAQSKMTSPAGEASRAISVTRLATENDPAAVVTIAERRIPLIDFQPVYETATGVAAVTRRNRGVESFVDAFIASGRDGADTVFRREGQKRYPLDEIFGPSVRDFIADEFPNHRKHIELILYAELQRAADRIINENFGYSTIGGFEEFLTDIA